MTVHFVRCPSYADSDLSRALTRLTADYFAAEDFSGRRVLLKPNFLIPEPVERAVTSHPAIILWFARQLKERGADVQVGDSPAVGPARAVARKLGLLEALAELDVPLIEFQAEDEQELSEPGLPWRRLKLAQAVRNADRVINLARLKTHGQMGLTMATKNLFGCVVGLQKVAWHFQAGKDPLRFTDLLLAVARLSRADFHLVDAVVAMQGNGPRSGQPRPLGFLAAGRDSLQLDAFVARLVGYRREELPMLARAESLGWLPEAEAEHDGDDPGALRIRDWIRARPADPGFRLPAWLRPLLERQLTPSPRVNPARCDACGLCRRACPAGCIDEERPVKIRADACIHCFCCQELCPRGAIEVHEALLARLLRRLRRS